MRRLSLVETPVCVFLFSRDKNVIYYTLIGNGYIWRRLYQSALRTFANTSMNGNNPYAGAPGVVDAGQPTDFDISMSQVRTLRRAVAGIVAQTEMYLPEGYAVGSELSYGTDGPQATVAVQPPAGRPVSAGFTPDEDDLESGLTDEDRDEVARGLAASAAFQVMNTVGDDITPTAR